MQPQSDWNFSTLKEHFAMLVEQIEKRTDGHFLMQERAVTTALSAQERAVNAALIAAEKAVSKAEASAEKRFEAVNEFRGQLADQTATLYPRSEAEGRLQALSEKLEEVRKDIAGLRESRSETGGRGAGTHAMWGYLFMAIGAATAIISIALMVSK